MWCSATFAEVSSTHLILAALPFAQSLFNIPFKEREKARKVKPFMMKGSTVSKWTRGAALKLSTACKTCGLGFTQMALYLNVRSGLCSPL